MATQQDQTALLRASITGNMRQVTRLLKAGVPPAAPHMFAAVQAGVKQVVALHAAANHELCNAVQANGTTPLHMATTTGNSGIVGVLLEFSPDPKALVEMCTASGSTSLLVASEGGHSTIVEQLLATGADATVSARCKDGSLVSPLYAASKNGHVTVVDLLLANPRAGAAIDAPDATGATPLYAACRHGRTKIVEVLLSSGARVNACTSAGLSPLLAAIPSGNASIVAMLCAHGADLDIEGPGSQTPLIAACTAGSWQIALSSMNGTAGSAGSRSDDAHPQLAIPKLLIHAGASIYRSDGSSLNNSGLAVHAAADAHGETALMELLEGARPSRSTASSMCGHVSDAGGNDGGVALTPLVQRLETLRGGWGMSRHARGYASAGAAAGQSRASHSREERRSERRAERRSGERRSERRSGEGPSSERTSERTSERLSGPRGGERSSGTAVVDGGEAMAAEDVSEGGVESDLFTSLGLAANDALSAGPSRLPHTPAAKAHGSARSWSMDVNDDGLRLQLVAADDHRLGWRSERGSDSGSEEAYEVGSGEGSSRGSVSESDSDDDDDDDDEQHEAVVDETTGAVSDGGVIVQPPTEAAFRAEEEAVERARAHEAVRQREEAEAAAAVRGAADAALRTAMATSNLDELRRTLAECGQQATGSVATEARLLRDSLREKLRKAARHRRRQRESAGAELRRAHVRARAEAAEALDAALMLQELLSIEGVEPLRTAVAAAETSARVLQGHGAEARVRAAQDRLRQLEAEEAAARTMAEETAGQQSGHDTDDEIAEEVASAQHAAATAAAETPEEETAERPSSSLLHVVVQGECTVCLDALNTHVLVPCGHKCVCATCAEAVRAHGHCPICRTPIVWVCEVYE